MDIEKEDKVSKVTDVSRVSEVSKMSKQGRPACTNTLETAKGGQVHSYTSKVSEVSTSE